MGGIPDEDVCRLNGAADRNMTQLQKIIKAGYDTVTPGVGQINFDPSTQRSEPVALTGALNAGYPSICGCFAGDARADRLNRRLKALKIPFGSQPDDTTTIRAAIKLKQQRVLIAIKISFGKSMTPDSAAAATWTTLRLLPWIITPFFEKFLEIDRRKEYHFPVPCGPAKPTCFARAAACLFQSAALAL